MNPSKALVQLKELEKIGVYERLAAQEWEEEWQILIATMLSAQTRDDVTIPIAKDLFRKFNSIKKLAAAKVEEIESAIKSINYYKTKAKNVKACAKELLTLHNAKVPHNIDQLILLPGIGRKTANVFMSEIGEDALGVDTHVARIAKKLGWTKNTNPDKIEVDLKALFPKKEWSRVNQALVRFGRQQRKNEDEFLEKLKGF